MNAPSLPFLFGQFYRQCIEAARGQEDQLLGGNLFAALSHVVLAGEFMAEAEVIAIAEELAAHEEAEMQALLAPLASLNLEELRASSTPIPDRETDPEGFELALFGEPDDGSVRAETEADFRRGMEGR